jgi:chemotaxis protein methyltransferase CheR
MRIMPCCHCRTTIRHVAKKMTHISKRNEGGSARLQTVFKVFGNILDSIREPLIFLDHQLHVIKANRSFYLTFDAKPDEAEGMLIFDLGNRQWNIPKLKRALKEHLQQNSILSDLRIEHTFKTVGRKILLLNARLIYQKTGQPELILLSIEDVTEREDQRGTLE